MSASEVILTGTGTPVPSPGRAGPGALVRAGGAALQVDAGRGTVLRLAEVGVLPPQLDAVLVTHHHSDHLVDLADLAMTRWVCLSDAPLTVVTPDGPGAEFARRVLDGWVAELEGRRDHAGRSTLPAVEVRTFPAAEEPAVVWSQGDARVTAVAVHHEPLAPAVAYRIDGPDGAIVISGDTAVCAEVEDLARGVDVLVHEACRGELIAPTPFAFVARYHSDTVELGGLAKRAGVATLVLTHLIPVPATEEQAQAFVDDVRRGGYDGDVIVGTDLLRVAIG